MGSFIGAWRTAAVRTGEPDVNTYLAKRDADAKWCSGCRGWHPRAAFGVDRHRGDGLASACRDAENQRGRALYAVRP